MPNPGNKPVIAVDLDDVLSFSADEFIRYTNKKWGTSLTVDDYTEEWAEIWKLDNRKELEKHRDEYIEYATPLVKSNPDALAVLNLLSKNHNLVISTARRIEYHSDTMDWLQTHYGDLFDEIHYAKILDEATKEKIPSSKTEILKQIGADYLIDDQPKHCIAAAGSGIKAILFGDYGWNRDIKLQPNMVRARNWQEVLEYFDGQAKQTV